SRVSGVPVSASPDGDRFLLWDAVSQVTCWDWTAEGYISGSRVQIPDLGGEAGRPLFTRDGKTVYAMAGKRVVTWDVSRTAEGVKVVQGMEEKDLHSYSLGSISSDGRQVLLYDQLGSLPSFLWDVHEGRATLRD